MAAPAERMKAMRARRRMGALREVRLVLPDARTRVVRAQVARAVARLDRDGEAGALDWIESVAEFDEPHANTAPPADEARRCRGCRGRR